MVSCSPNRRLIEFVLVVSFAAACVPCHSNDEYPYVAEDPDGRWLDFLVGQGTNFVSAGPLSGAAGCALTDVGEMICWYTPEEESGASDTTEVRSLLTGIESLAYGSGQVAALTANGGAYIVDVEDTFLGAPLPDLDAGPYTRVVPSVGSVWTCTVELGGTTACETADQSRRIDFPGVWRDVLALAGDDHLAGETDDVFYTLSDAGEIGRWSVDGTRLLTTMTARTTDAQISGWGNMACVTAKHGIQCESNGIEVSHAGCSPPKHGDITALAAGGDPEYVSCATDDKNRPYCWNDRQSAWTPDKRFRSINGRSSFCGVDESGRIQCWGDSESLPNALP